MSPGIADYMFRYGFRVTLNERVEQMVNDAILQPGSYYAYGRMASLCQRQQPAG